MIGLLIIICISPFAAYVALQFPSVQTAIAHKALNSLEKNLDGKIGVGKISVVFFNKIILHDVSVVGNRSDSDTLGMIRKLSVSFYPKNLLIKRRLDFNRVSIENGVFNLVTEDTLGHSNLGRIFRIPDEEDSIKGNMPLVNISEIYLRDMRYSMVNSFSDTVEKNPATLNFSDLHLHDINAEFQNFQMGKDKISAKVKNLSTISDNGYRLYYLHGLFAFQLGGHWQLDDLSLKDSYSTVNAHCLSFTHHDRHDYQYFLTNVIMSGDFYNTSLDFRSIGAYAQSLVDNDLKIGVNGKITGPVSALKSDDLFITFEDSTRLNLAVSLTGLPDVENTEFEFEFKDINTKTSDAEYILSRFVKNLPEGAIADIVPGRMINLKGSAAGKYLDFNAKCFLNADIGNLYLDIISDRNPVNEEMHVEGYVNTSDLDIGEITGSGLLGELTMRSKIDARIGGSNIHPNVKISSLNIDRFNVNDYDYSRIHMKGSLVDNDINLWLLSNDEAFPLNLDGNMKMRDGGGPEDINLQIYMPGTDLKAVNIVKEGEKAYSELWGKARLHVRENGLVFGKIDLHDFTFANDNGRYFIDSVIINSVFRNGEQIISLKSPVIEMNYASDGDPKETIRRIKKNLIANNFPSLLTMEENNENVKPIEKDYCKLRIKALDINPVLAVHFPSLRIADSTAISLDLDKYDKFSLMADSKAVYSGNLKLKDISLDLKNDNRGCDLALNGDNVNIGGIILENNKISARGQNDSLFIKYAFHNSTTELKDSMDFSSVISFDHFKDKLITVINVEKSKLLFKNFNWYFDPCRISVGNKYYNFENFNLYCDKEYLRINGLATPDLDSTIDIDLNNFDISILNAFIKNKLNLQGFFSGNVSISKLFAEGGIFVNLNGEEISIADREIDRMSIMTKWDNSKERFNILIKNQLKNNQQFSALGYYNPGENIINLKLALNEFGLYYLTPIIEDFISIEQGSVTGDINISGPFNKLSISSENCKIDSLLLIPKFTLTPYILDGNIAISEHDIDIDNIKIIDKFGHRGNLQGNIHHNYFSDISLDTKLFFTNLQFLNTRESDNDTFYGNAFASGNISLYGMMNDLSLETEFRTTGNTVIHVPLSSASSATKSDLISYKTKNFHIDKYDMMFEDKEKKESEKTNIDINAKVKITPETELMIEFDKQLGEILRCKGNGDIDVEINPSKNIMNLRGDYTISEGSYHLPLYVQSKDFLINEGGTLQFNGDFKNTQLNVGATYRTKASISTLISDSTSVGTRRTIDCGINLNGKLNNPILTFSINIPDMDPITKGRVESALSTPDKVQRQFIALLISGSFIPDQESGIVNNSTILYSNASEILANQFNNIFRQLDIPLDLGLNYQPGKGNNNKDMFDVAISYQAFNNRLIINGNVGNKENSSNWGGNLEAEYKIDKNGKFRVTLFTRAADDFSNYLDNTQRSGFGFTFQDEFDTLGELWRNIFYSKKRREEYELEQLKKAEKEIRKEAEEANLIEFK